MSSKILKLVWAPIVDSDQPAHPRSLIRVFDGRSIGRQVSNISSGGKARLRLGCLVAQTDFNLRRCMHMSTCNFYWLPAPIINHLPATGPSCSSICQYVTAELLGNNVFGLAWSTGLMRRCTEM